MNKHRTEIRLLNNAQRKIRRVLKDKAEDLRPINRDRLKEGIALINEVKTVLKEEGTSPKPTWSFEEAVSFKGNWLRGGRVKADIDAKKYSMAMALGVLSDADKHTMLQAHVDAGYTHYAFSIQDGPNKYWRLNKSFILTPEQAAETADLIWQVYGLIPVPQLFTQDQLKNLTLDELEDWAQPYADALNGKVGFVWATFEHNEHNAVHPKSKKEGLWGDNWIGALAGRLERQWACPIGLHQSAGEFHYYTKYSRHDEGMDDWFNSGEEFPKRPILLFQCNSAYPNPNDQAHVGDWRYVLQRCRAETGDRQICIPFEYCQETDGTVDWDDFLVAQVGTALANVSKAEGMFPGFGNGGKV